MPKSQKGQFQKGQSGNPGGRPKSKELRDLCREYTADAVKELGRLAMKAKGEMTRVIAIRELLDRGYGRPMQAVEVAVEDSRAATSTERRQLSPPQVLEMLGQLLTEVEKERGIDPNTGLSEKERLDRLLESGDPIPPDLYRAWQLYRGTSVTQH